MSEVFTTMNSVYPAHFQPKAVSLRGDWRIPVLLFIGILLAGGLLTLPGQKRFTAQASVEIQLPEATDLTGQPSPDRLNAENFLETQASAIADREFLGNYAAKAGLAKKWKLKQRDVLEILERSTVVSRRPGFPLIDIFYYSSNPDDAIEAANGLAQSFAEHWRHLHDGRETITLIQKDKDLIDSSAEAQAKEFSRLQSLRVNEKALSEAMREWETTKARSVQTAQLLAQVSRESATIQDAARIKQVATRETTVAESSFPNRFVYVAILGFVAAGMTAVFQFLGGRAKTSISAIDKAVAPPTLTLLPRDVVNLADNPDPFRKLRVAILNSHPDPDGVTIVSTSFLNDEDASGISCELAKVLAIGGHSTLLIDGNLLEPSIHRQFDAAPRPGMTEYLVEDMALHETVVKSRIANLWVMPAGSSRENPAKILGSERMSKLLGEAKRRFDFIVINSPSLMVSTDSLTLIGESDMTFLTTEAGRSRRDILVKARNAIEQAGGNLSGLVLTQVGPQEVLKRNADSKEIQKPG